MMNQHNKPLNILHIIISVTDTNSQFNDHCLPMMDKRNIAICTYYKSAKKIPSEIATFEGDNTLIGFFRALKAALDYQEYDAIHAHAVPTGILLLLGMIIFGKYQQFIDATVYTIHTSYANLKPRNRLLIIPIFATFKKVIPCSHASFTSLPKFLKNLGGKKLQIVQNGVDLSRIDRVLVEREKTLKNDDVTQDFMVISIGRLIKVKNPLCLLRIFQEISDRTINLLLIGDGAMKSNFIAEMINRQLENRIKMTGLIAREAVYQHLANADLFVSTSWVEGLPVAVLEAMGCGCPVILSDIPPHREIADGVDFVPLIHPDDAVGFAEEITRFRQMSASQRAEIGQKCRQLVEEKFSLTAMHQGYEAVYRHHYQQAHQTEKKNQKFPITIDH
ncbi:glycosyltransferase family 4 protein [Tolypothrix sp. FACHB-123]|uniref:glycosyltransferase family 4 protein n=1 Tax=Tolypothrix sp. FACHB-123 TaxID=2692868 RepID=UPI001684C9B4|nr:glycosyltransferase family 4 protein [Tolypothrix sp. FACHB-123]MBD2355851.1 glycosyltransferase family 4 protein [Tolypothrix sp. FACHB-123]